MMPNNWDCSSNDNGLFVERHKLWSETVEVLSKRVEVLLKRGAEGDRGSNE